jgi:hypothetical protein
MFDVLVFYIKAIGLKDSTQLFISIVGVFVTFVGIVVTGFFSFLLWKATVNTNRLTEANLQLASSIADIEKMRYEGKRNHYRLELWKRVNLIEVALNKQKNKLDYEILISAYEKYANSKLPDEAIGEYFSEEERFLKDSVWITFYLYMKQYWIDNNGEYIKKNQRLDYYEVIEATEHPAALAQELRKLLEE